MSCCLDEARCLTTEALDVPLDPEQRAATLAFGLVFQTILSDDFLSPNPEAVIQSLLNE